VLSDHDVEEIILEEMGNTEDPEELILADTQTADKLEASIQADKPTSEQTTHDEYLVKSLKDVAMAQMTVRGVTISAAEAVEALKIIPKVGLCIAQSM
jgi:hypothetical protein